jgi:EAL domain-containing protein (putative c-di-GMP-specific phosphodiesterase class I)
MRHAIRERLALEADMQRGIRRNEFVLHYQPIMDLQTRETVAVEALARWHHPVRGLLSPAAFIPVAEETGAIVEIGRWALREACRQLADWQARFPRESQLAMSVNVSGRQLQQPRLASDVASAIAEAGIDPCRLVLELTETIMTHATEETLESLAALKRHGVLLALDDFGVGYSSLSYLRTFPLDVLKIPRPFVDGIDRGPEESALARASLQLGDTFGLDVIAEGIETDEQRAQLEVIGCRLGQGFLLARPAPSAEIERHLAGPRVSTPVRPLLHVS